MSNSKKRTAVYEVIDQTSDEIYYSLGIWLSLEDAVGSIAGKDVDSVDVYGNSGDECFSAVIKKHEVGWSQGGVEVYKVVWENVYNEEEDDCEWTSRAFSKEKREWVEVKS